LCKLTHHFVNATKRGAKQNKQKRTPQRSAKQSTVSDCNGESILLSNSKATIPTNSSNVEVSSQIFDEGQLKAIFRQPQNPVTEIDQGGDILALKHATPIDDSDQDGTKDDCKRINQPTRNGGFEITYSDPRSYQPFDTEEIRSIFRTSHGVNAGNDDSLTLKRANPLCDEDEDEDVEEDDNQNTLLLAKKAEQLHWDDRLSETDQLLGGSSSVIQ
jgi:hypothetical protein